MSLGRLIAWLAFAMALGLSAHAQPALNQDVEFLRGCWVAKAAPGGPAVAFLRLLPEDADRPVYRGPIQVVRGTGMSIEMSFAFARNGAEVQVYRRGPGSIFPLEDLGDYTRRPARKLPDAVDANLPHPRRRATFAVYGDKPLSPFLVAEGDGQTIRIYLISHGGEMIGDLFTGERDGCD